MATATTMPMLLDSANRRQMRVKTVRFSRSAIFEKYPKIKMGPMAPSHSYHCHLKGYWKSRPAMTSRQMGLGGSPSGIAAASIAGRDARNDSGHGKARTAR